MSECCVGRLHCWPRFRLTLIWLGLMLGSLFAGNVMAATFNSAQSGFWDVGSTWAGGAPPATGDKVTILNGHTVTVRANATVDEVTVNAGGTLRGDGNGPWTFTYGKGGGADFTVNGTLDFASGQGVVLTLSKNSVWAGSGTWNLSKFDYANRSLNLTTFSNTINFSGNPTPITGTTGFITSSSATVWNFTGSAVQTLPNTANVRYGSIRISNSTTVTLGIGLNAANLLAGIAVQSGTLANGGFAIVGTAGNTFSVANGATFLLTGTSTMVTGFGTKTFGSTLPTCSTVNYGGTAQTVSNESYGNLTLSGSGAKTMPATPMTVACNFTMSVTASATTAGALTVGGNFSIGATNTFANGANALNVAGNFTQNGTFTAGAGVVTLNGGAAVQTISGTGPLGFTNLTVINTGGITLARDVTVTSAIIGAVTLTSTCPIDYTLTSNGGATVQHSCAGPDHYELSLPTSSIACLSSTATVTACADTSSPCTNPFTAASGTTATLTASAGTLGAATVTFDAFGVASTTLSYPAAADGAPATVTLSGEQSSATNPRKCCPDGAGCVVADSCTSTFNTAGFILSDTAGGAAATIPAQVAGTTSSTYYLRAVKTSTITKACESALAGANTVNFAYECNNPATCYTTDLMSVNGTTIARNNNGSVSSYTSVNMTFDVNGNAPFTFNYGDVGQVTLHTAKAAGGTLLTPLTGATNAFVVQPFGFVLSGIQQTAAPNLANPAAANALGAKFVKAGENFTATVTAVSFSGSTTPNYGKEAAPEGVTLSNALVAPAAGVNPALANPAAFGAFSNGVATGTTFNWSEVGIITLTPSVADGNYLGAGDITGTTSANVGRFYPDHFVASFPAVPPLTNRVLSGCASSFTYAGEQMQADFTLTARNGLAAPTTTVNYSTANSFAKLDGTVIANFGFGAVDLADATVPLMATALTANLALVSSSGTWTNGVSAFAARLNLNRAAAPDGPYESFRLGILPADSDGVTLRIADLDLDTTVPADGNDQVRVGSSMVRFGRLKLSNAHGSELLNLPIPIETQYWNGTSFVRNTDDNCTSLTAANITLGTYQGGITAANLDTPAGSHISIGGAFVAGRGTLKLTKPSPTPATSGSANLTVDLAAASKTYLQGAWTGATYNQNPVSHATFGVYKGSNEFIYQRENY